jgi:hypothetical protein
MAQEQEEPMNRQLLCLAVLSAAAVLALSAALARADEKDKPKGATLDDRAATVTETTDGKETTTKLELKYTLKIKGIFDKDGLRIEELDADGPMNMLKDGDGNVVGMAEKGDVIREMDGKAIKSAKDYVKALNEAADANKIKVKLKDINTGNDQEFYVSAQKR